MLDKPEYFEFPQCSLGKCRVLKGFLHFLYGNKIRGCLLTYFVLSRNNYPIGPSAHYRHLSSSKDRI